MPLMISAFMRLAINAIGRVSLLSLAPQLEL